MRRLIVISMMLMVVWVVQSSTPCLASMIAFIRDGNVWVTDQNGAQNRQVTRDGTKPAAATAYAVEHYPKDGRGYLAVVWLQKSEVMFLQADTKGVGRIGVLDIASGKKRVFPRLANVVAGGVDRKTGYIGYLQVTIRTDASSGEPMFTATLGMVDATGKVISTRRLFTDDPFISGFYHRLSFSLDGKRVFFAIPGTDVSPTTHIDGVAKPIKSPDNFLRYDWWNGRHQAQPCFRGMSWMSGAIFVSADDAIDDNGEKLGGLYKVSGNQVSRLCRGAFVDVVPGASGSLLLTAEQDRKSPAGAKDYHVYRFDLQQKTAQRIITNATCPTWIP